LTRRSSSLKQTKFWRKVRDVDAGKHDTANALACEESLMRIALKIWRLVNEVTNKSFTSNHRGYGRINVRSAINERSLFTGKIMPISQCTN
jgi:hypothetical protein